MELLLELVQPGVETLEAEMLGQVVVVVVPVADGLEEEHVEDTERL